MYYKLTKYEVEANTSPPKNPNNPPNPQPTPSASPGGCGGLPPSASNLFPVCPLAPAVNDISLLSAAPSGRSVENANKTGRQSSCRKDLEIQTVD